MQNSPRGRLPDASSSPQGSRLSSPHRATFSPVPRHLVTVEGVRQRFFGHCGHTYEVLVPLSGPRTQRTHSFLIPEARSFADAEKLGSELLSTLVVRCVIGSRGQRLWLAHL